MPSTVYKNFLSFNSKIVSPKYMIAIAKETLAYETLRSAKDTKNNRPVRMEILSFLNISKTKTRQVPHTHILKNKYDGDKETI